MFRSSIRKTLRASATLAAAVALTLIGGCGPSASPSDKIDGRKALLSALDAWKAGETPASLEKLSPPIHATDTDWLSGFQLQNYKADEEGKLVGTDVNFKVELELKSPKGKAEKKSAVYAVTTHPQVLVLRQDGL